MFKKLFILGMLVTSLFGDVRELTDENFSKATARGLVVVEFWATWNEANKVLVIDEWDTFDAKVYRLNIDLKTMIYIGSLLVSGITMYFTFMGELDARFGALEDGDSTMMVDMDKRLTAMETSVDKRLTDLENKFTPIGDGVYSVDPNSTWPPSRGEYKMKDEMSRNKIMVLEDKVKELKEEIEKLEDKVIK